MTRREFFRMALGGAAAVAVAPYLPAALPTQPTPILAPVVATIGAWRSWHLESDKYGYAIMVEDGRSENWED